MIDIAAKDILARLTPEQVESAYEGRADRCACGCSGTYYGPGYVEPNNEAKVALILKRVQRRAEKAAAGEVEALWTHTYSDGHRMWAYQTKSMLIRIESRSN
jgi:hypothetical protein